MGARRDDMSISERMQIAAAALAPEPTRGTITALARAHGVSRQTVYTLAATARQALRSSLLPQPHGPHPADAVIAIDRNRLQRAVVVLTEAGVSQRALTRCLAELLDTLRSPAWVNTTLAQLVLGVPALSPASSGTTTPIACPFGYPHCSIQDRLRDGWLSRCRSIPLSDTSSESALAAHGKVGIFAGRPKKVHYG